MKFQSTAINPPPKPSIPEGHWKTTPRMLVLLDGHEDDFFIGRLIEHENEHAYWIIEQKGGIDPIVTHFCEIEFP